MTRKKSSADRVFWSTGTSVSNLMLNLNRPTREKS